MANVLVGRRVVQSKQIAVGAAELFSVEAGQLVQIIDMAGAQVAAMVAWLCSDSCSFNTGAVFDLSGGRATY